MASPRPDSDFINSGLAIILVNAEKHPRVKSEAGQAFVDWILSEEGQGAIAGYRIDGQQLFFPNAGG